MAGLVCVVAIAALLAGPAYAEGNTVYHSRGYDWLHAWSQGIPFDATDRYNAADGSICYCLNLFVDSPSSGGTYYPDSFVPPQAVIAAMYYGYPNRTNFGGIQLSDDQARCATQFAVWALNTSGYGRQLDMSSMQVMPSAPGGAAESQKVIDAVWWLVAQAQQGFPNPVAEIVPPADKTPQLFSDTLRRIGPFSLASTVSAQVSTSGLPEGSYVGDAAGNPLAAIGNGSFYLYLPAAALTAAGSGNVHLEAQYDIHSGIGYTGANALQDMGKFIVYQGGNSGDYPVEWFAATVEKTETGSGAPVADTEFVLERQDAGGGFTEVARTVTDADGKIVFPGLGTGTWRVTETRPNPAYASCAESGGAASHTFTVGPGNPPEIQTFENDGILLSCQVDKDTIRKTSAGYRALPDEEGIDNVGTEEYRYDVDYRSTASVAADEFTVDDVLEETQDGRIRLQELITPVCYGDTDGLMNIWYRTNKTDEGAVYAAVSAMADNPYNPNNPAGEAVFPNTGWQLWAAGVPTTSRTHLAVSELGLAEDEYITALRYEHGAVEKGFTTKNYDSASENGEHRNNEKAGIYADHVDWTPLGESADYVEEAAEAVGLKPVSYLVSCPAPLDEEVQITASVTAHIARNRVLTDVDTDEVVTVPVGTFTLEPREPIPSTPEIPSYIPQTGDGRAPWIPLLFVLAALTAAVIAGILILRRSKRPRVTRIAILASVFVTLAMAVGFSLAPLHVFAAEKDADADQTVSAEVRADGGSESRVNRAAYLPKALAADGLRYTLISGSDVTDDGGARHATCEYMTQKILTAAEWDADGGKSAFPASLSVQDGGFSGSLVRGRIEGAAQYASIEEKVDKTEVISGLSSNEVDGLPEEKTFTVRSDSAPGATQEVTLRRAGIQLTPTAFDEDGLASEWEAVIVYRGLETYLEPDSYIVCAFYDGEAVCPANPREPASRTAAAAPVVKTAAKPAPAPAKEVAGGHRELNFRDLIKGMLRGEPKALAVGLGAPLTVFLILLLLIRYKRHRKQAGAAGAAA
ncbi:MAG: Cys-Gln thioester bond-forming surface protein [Clostridiales Family XIII bacterium]|nr:Cys-Gln thioester bond-forming surface protein [Clostridiales Family XIII bacterium]